MPQKVLVVEDSRAMRFFVSSILEATGEYEVTEVDNGFDALRTLPRVEFGLVITDVNMPDVSGIELTKFLRSHSKYENVPVVVISTDSSQVDKRRVLEAGATAFLAKPFTAEELLAVIRQAGTAAGGGGKSEPSGDAEG